MKIGHALRAVMAAGLLVAAPATGQAQSVEEFYSQNDITMVVGTAAGGSTDFFARAIAPYLTKYLPGNPDIIVQNKAGAGGLVVAAEIQNTMPADGSYIGTLQRNNFTDPLFSDERIDFDAREIKHIGSIGKEVYVIFQYPENPGVASVGDALAHEMILAGTGAGSANNTFPNLVNKLHGGKFKVVPGYSGNEEQALAIERGEADGRAGSYAMTQRGQLKQWQDEGKLHYVMQFALEPSPDLPGVPNIFEAATTDEERRIWRFMLVPQALGRVFSAPGDIPEDRLAALREAFNQAATDPEFIAEIELSGGDPSLTTGEELQAIADELMGTPPEIVAKIKELMAE
jgi:tripartite-type tricarboxylate transporter receptor subunit TctC